MLYLISTLLALKILGLKVLTDFYEIDLIIYYYTIVDFSYSCSSSTSFTSSLMYLLFFGVVGSLIVLGEEGSVGSLLDANFLWIQSVRALELLSLLFYRDLLSVTFAPFVLSET